MREEIQKIEEMIKYVLDITIKKDGVCLYMGAVLFAQIVDNSLLKPKFVTGSLTVKNKVIFAHKPIKHVITAGNNFAGSWDGHAWVEVDDFIFDPSVFCTIFSSTTPLELQSLFHNVFKEKHDYLIGSRASLEESGVVYTAYEELSNSDATVLINSGFNAGFFDKNKVLV